MGAAFSRNRPLRLVAAAFAQPVILETLGVLGLSLAAGMSFYSNVARAGLGALTLSYLMLPMDSSLLPLSRNRLAEHRKQAERVDHFVDVAWSDAVRPCGPATHEQYVVVGGAGFLGRRIVHALLLRGETKVRVVDMDDAGLKAMAKDYGDRIQVVRADVTKRADADAFLQGAKAVFAPVASIRFWEWEFRHYQRSTHVNVTGAKVLTEACIAAGVKRLVATSTATVVLDFPGYFANGVDESTPVTTWARSCSNYSSSKAEGEAIYLEANGQGGLAVGVCRPCTQIYGFKDKLYFERMLTGYPRDSAIVLDGNLLTDYVHVDHVVLAELLLEARLRNGPSDPAAGEAYNIRGGEPTTCGYFAALCEKESDKALGRHVMARSAPGRIVCLLSYFVTLVQWLYPGNADDLLGSELGHISLPTLLTGLAHMPAKNDDKARTLLGFRPHTSPSVAIRRTFTEYRLNHIIMDVHADMR